MTRCIKDFKGWERGVFYSFKKGDEIPNDFDLARVAISEGWAKAKPAPKNKAMQSLINKCLSASRPGRVSRKKMSKRSKR